MFALFDYRKHRLSNPRIGLYQLSRNLQWVTLAVEAVTGDAVGRLVGLGDWRLMVALLTSFVAKENMVATPGILVGAGESESGLARRVARVLTPSAALAFLVVQMLFILCVATVAVIRQETGVWKWTALSVALQLAPSLAVGIAVYQVGRLI